MRRFYILLCLLLIGVAPALHASTAKVIKVLPQFLDKKGRVALSPSLFERDAYQAELRKTPSEQAALRFCVQWKASGVDWSKVKLRLEARGVLGNSLINKTLEMPVKKTGWFTTWSEFKLSGVEFEQFGNLISWHATLWEGDKQIAEQKSFLW